jgi:mRNA-degrading endonuclease toxin of MazEF toxin-antitoxin module
MGSASPPLPKPLQGEIWFIKYASDPPEYDGRPVVVVSLDGRNTNDRAESVLVMSLSTTLKDPLIPSNLRLSPGETGLQELSELQASSITTVRKSKLRPPRSQLRRLSRGTIKRLVPLVGLAMGILPEELAE